MFSETSLESYFGSSKHYFREDLNLYFRLKSFNLLSCFVFCNIKIKPTREEKFSQLARLLKDIKISCKQYAFSTLSIHSDKLGFCREFSGGMSRSMHISTYVSTVIPFRGISNEAYLQFAWYLSSPDTVENSFLR